MSSLVLKPATEILRLVASREVSVSEVAEAHISQIERWNPRLNAMVDFDADRVREQARALEHHPGARGPLHGLPVTVKASIAVAGHRCETGSLLNEGHRPALDAPVVARLRQAGALILGTTNCPEFLMAYETDNRLYGRTSNPWDLTRTAGGSSGGESAAIAAGLSAGGLGSDGGGSVREPAHFTGICALKPTPGRVPAEGHLPPCYGPFSVIGTIGPMARTIGDVDLLFRTVSGPLRTDPIAAPVTFRDQKQEDLKAFPIGFFADDGLVPVTADTRATLRNAVEALRDRGFRLVRFRPKSLESARQLWWKLFVKCGEMLLDPVIKDRTERLSPLFLDFLSIAQGSAPLNANDVLQAWVDLDRIRFELLQEMQSFPLLLHPVCAVPAFLHGEREWRIDRQKVRYLDAMRYTQWWNVLGGPAAVVPVGKSREGLPIGVQIAGRPYDDETVLSVARLLEKTFGHPFPPMI